MKMNPNLFYTNNTEKAVSLYLLTKTQWQEGIITDPLARNCFINHQFKGELGDLCLFTNSENELDKVYIGAGNNEIAQALAYAALRLPPGSYLPQLDLPPLANLLWSLAQYQYLTYKKCLINPRVLVISEMRQSAILAEANALFFVRDLINKPANDLDCAALADAVYELAKKHNAQFTQWVGKELLAHNFPAIYAVGKAADSEPRLLSLAWGNKKNPHIVLVGKGVCFDSGGLDLKPAAGMQLMKKDMGGAAHVLGLAQWIMTLNLPIYLQILIPAVENAIGPKAYRPGDIIRMRNGLTVEIGNTDAEGRLIVADALTKACEEKPDLVIDFTTLTGAARVAVGTEIAALFTNDDSLAHALYEAAIQVEDPLWRLPLFAGYESMLNSSVADLSNQGSSPYAGAITAALFLQRFVDKSIPWVHFDLMAWNITSKPGKPEGGEAMALRALSAYLLRTYGTDTI